MGASSAVCIDVHIVPACIRWGGNVCVLVVIYDGPCFAIPSMVLVHLGSIAIVLVEILPIHHLQSLGL